MDTPLEESNLAGIGSEEDKELRRKAAALDHNWEGAGQEIGVEIWRVENDYDEKEQVPRFGIKPWPKDKYGDFFRGDSYIVLQTSEDEDGVVFHDIYFWIGSLSSQDEYGVAAYKANELDDYFGDAPVQHREVEGYESDEFMKCFPKGVHYLEGGVESGFRKVDSEKALYEIPTRLLHIRRVGKVVRHFQVPISCDSLNLGDSFFLDTGKKIYTWYGPDCSPFERRHTADLAHNTAGNRFGHTKVEIGVGDENEEFWSILGGRKEIKPADAFQDKDVPSDVNQMYVFSDEKGHIQIEQVEPKKENLDSEKVCVIDAGRQVFVWVGKDSSAREQSSSMLAVERYLKTNDRSKITSVLRVTEGQRRVPEAFEEALN